MEHLLKIISKPDNIPIVLLLGLVVFYAWYGLRQAVQNDREKKPWESEESDKIQVWPYLVRVEFLGALIVMVILTFWSFLIDAPLEEPANPALTPNPSKAPWYFLGL